MKPRTDQTHNQKAPDLSASPNLSELSDSDIHSEVDSPSQKQLLLDSRIKGAECLETIFDLMIELNYNQNQAYKAELQEMFQDHYNIDNPAFYLYLLVMVSSLNRRKQYTRQVHRQEMILSDESIDKPVMCYSQSYELQQIVEYIQLYQPGVIKALGRKNLKSFELPRLIADNHSKMQTIVHFLILNRMKELSKQFFKLMPIRTLVDIVLKKSKNSLFDNCLYVNIVCKLIYKYQQNINIVKSIDDLIKDYIEEQNQEMDYQLSLRALVMYMVERRYQFILLYLLSSKSKYVIVDKHIFRSILENRLYILLKEYVSYQPFQSIAKDPDILEVLVIDNTKESFLFYQILVMPIISSKYVQYMTNSQQEQVLHKYQQLLSQPSLLKSLYFNSLYIICKLSLDLNNFVDQSNGYRAKYQLLAQQYNDLAYQEFMGIQSRSCLYMMLFQKHYHQERLLIEVLFQNKGFFAKILNIPQIYQVLYQLWKGNIKCKSNFMQETYYYQVLRHGYQIVLPRKIAQQKEISEQRHKQEVQEVEVMAQYQKERAAQRERLTMQEFVETGLPENIPEQEDRAMRQMTLRHAQFKSNIYQQVNKESEYNIFKYLQRDMDDILVSGNYAYQYEIYLKNLLYKRIMDTVFFVTSFLMFLYLIHLTIDIINPCLIQYTPELMELIEFKVPHAYSNNLTIDPNYEEVLKSIKLSPEKYAEIYAQKNYRYFCILRKKVMFFTPESFELESAYMDYCTKFMYFYEYKNQGIQSKLRIVIYSNLSMSVTQILTTLYTYLVHRRVHLNIALYYEVITIIFYLRIIVSDYTIYDKYFYDKRILTFYRMIQYSSIFIVSVMFIRILLQFRIFKELGMYIVITQKVLMKIFFFIMIFLSLVITAALIFSLLFAGLVKGNYLGFDSLIDSIMQTMGYTLGNINIYFVTNSNPIFIDQYFLWPGQVVNVLNVMTLLLILFVSVILLNILVANITFMYESVQQNTKRKFSQLLYNDYKDNQPSRYYSSLFHGALPFGLMMLVVLPLVVFCRSAKLNSALNVLIYTFRFFVPFLCMYYVTNLLLLPLVYFKLLLCILKGKYANQNQFVLKVPMNTKIIHFISFLIVGPFYLLGQLLISDLIYIIRKAAKKTPEQTQLLFNLDIYKVLKKTLHHFKYVKGEGLTEIEQFISKLKENYECSQMEKTQKIKEKFRIVVQRLEFHAGHSHHYNLVDVEYLVTMLDIMKNKRYDQGADQNQMQLEKMKSLQILFNQFDSVYEV